MGYKALAVLAVLAGPIIWAIYIVISIRRQGL